jgi:DNA-binding response OmpR family regulator
MLDRNAKRTAMSEHPDFTDNRLSPAQLNRLLDRMDSTIRGTGADDRRNAPRGRRRLCDVQVEIEQPGGGIVRSLCCTRNICARGVSLILGSHVHHGSTVTLALSRPDGRRDTIRGTVIHCRHAEGSIHEIGVELDRIIDATLYVYDDDALAELQAGDEDADIDMRGCLLHVSTSYIERQLVRFHLAGTNIELFCADSRERALEDLRSGVYDAILLDLDSMPDDPVQLIKLVRSTRFPGRLVANTADDRIAAVTCRQAGVDDLLRKPVAPGALQAVMLEALERAGCVIRAPEIYSMLPSDSYVSPMLAGYIAEVRLITQRLEQAMQADDLLSCRRCCLWLKGSGAPFGFPIITDRAVESLAVLDAANSVDRSVRPLRQLVLACGRLAVREAA